MRDHMKLNANQKREIVVKALRGAEKTALAVEYGISRQRVYDLLEEVRDDPGGKFEEAVAEAAFRREVRDILAEGGGG